MIRNLIPLAAAYAIASSPAPAQEPLGGGPEDPVIVVEGQPYFSWREYTSSLYFQYFQKRCATPAFNPNTQPPSFLGPQDYTYGSTNPNPIYDPIEVYTIPVVVHVIRSTSGQGNISASMVQSQIDILNEDFLALAGTNGAPGTDVKIQFELASVDPQGNPTNGITYSNNNTWFNDGGGYYNTLAWDTNRYMNIYTNKASGALGYVPDLPQGGIVGSPADRIVVLWSAFGRNAPIGPPFNQGRTATHEVGHYLGLWHTFDGSCGSQSACYTTGDRLCDTPQESQPSFGCPGNKSSCGSADPIHNYMDYSDDLCMWEFSPEQSNRMRCTLLNYRPDLFEFGEPGSGVCFGDGSSGACPCNNNGANGEGCRNSTGDGARLSATGSSNVAQSDLVLHVAQGAPNKVGVMIQGSSANGIPFQDGLLCAGTPIRRIQVLALDAAGAASTSAPIASTGGAQPGQTLAYQFWYRDAQGPCGKGSNLTHGYEVSWQ